MEIKLIKILITSSIVMQMCTAQNSFNLSLENIYIDSISLKNARYELKDFGIVTDLKKWQEEYDEYTEKYEEKTYDSLKVQISYINQNRIYIDWIIVTGKNHTINIDSMGFNLHDSITVIKNYLPNIYHEYMKYLNKGTIYKEILLYIGIPIKIINVYAPDKYHYGAIKFGILDSKIREIIIDLRPDGEYD